MAESNDNDKSQVDKEARREKHKKRMNKILLKAWNITDSKPFQESPSSRTTDSQVRDLTAVGVNLDKGVYEHGRTGWELFARDMGCVYNWHIMRKGKHAASAKAHMEKVVDFFSRIDPILGNIVVKSKPSEEAATDNHSISDRKRKNGDVVAYGDSPKKKSNLGRNGSLSLSQRETMAMEALATYLEERGGERGQTEMFRCKVVQRPGGRYDSIFFSVENKRFKSMAEVSRFLNLSDRPTVNNRRRLQNHSRKNKANSRNPKDFERKKLKRELEKLLKSQVKAAKLLEDHKNESLIYISSTDNDLPLDNTTNDARTKDEARTVPRSDFDAFPGIPRHCIPELLMVWDFLCTFSRTLSLEPIDLDDFAAALSFLPFISKETLQPGNEMDHPSFSTIPVYVSEAHLALLRLLIGDASSDTWWWSVLETPEMVEEEGDEYLNAVERRRKSAPAVIKIDIEGLLNVEEDSEVTSKWLQVLEDIRNKSPDRDIPIKNAVKSAMSITTNHLVKTYLKKTMRKWRARSAGLVKRAVGWLVDKVREARPDLMGRSVSTEEIMEQKRFVVLEASLEMSRIVEEDEDDINGEMNIEGYSDEELEADEDDVSDVEYEDTDQLEVPVSPPKQSCSISPNENDEIMPISTFIPMKPVPSFVDLLLPPSKPSLASDLIHGLTWPPVVGATCLRILHWYKRRRNEVDDSIREFRQLRPMSVAERRRRESSASLRILSECGDQCDDKIDHVENSIQHLCDGKDYLALTVVQRLCLLRILIEAAYDTFHIQQTIEDNFKARMNAIKALDLEERRAKKECREELVAIETAARERLAKDAQEAFLEKKRQEIIECIEDTDLTEEDLEDMEDQEIIEFDEETKAEYDALPTPESFNKSEVNSVVTKIQEESAFGAEVFTSLTLKEIEKKDEQHLKSLEDELESLSADRDSSVKIDRIRKEITSFMDKNLTLSQERKIAIDMLKDAIEDGTVKTLRSAIKSAKLAQLSGDDEQTGGVWALDLLRDAALELKNAESRKRVTMAQKDLIAKRNKCFIRTEPLGRDRYRSRFVHFDYDKNSRIWVERDVLIHNDGFSVNDKTATLPKNSQIAALGARDQYEDFLAEDDHGQPYADSFLSFTRQEYHPSAKLSTLVEYYWSCYTTDRSLRNLVKTLAGKSETSEMELKESLKEFLETMVLASGGEKAASNVELGEEAATEKKESSNFRISGDENIFQQEKENIASEDSRLLEKISSALGCRIRLRQVPDSDRAPDVVQYIMGTITGWKVDVTPMVERDSQSGEMMFKRPIWRLALDDGGDLHIASREVIDGIIRAIKWSNQCSGYVEHDAAFLTYRNSLGRFCGRAAEAPSSLTPLAFTKQMLKREQEIYMPLKNRSSENNWGGKSGARNAWVSSLKEHGDSFEAVRDGLLTLEMGLFELSGGFDSAETILNNETEGLSHKEDSTLSSTNLSKLSGKDLLYSDVDRFDIELESLGNEVKGLWNSADTRDIFREIISVCETVSILALGLELLCRNCKAFINRTKSSIVQPEMTNADPLSSSYRGRRCTAMQRPGAYTDFF